MLLIVCGGGKGAGKGGGRGGGFWNKIDEDMKTQVSILDSAFIKWHKMTLPPKLTVKQIPKLKTNKKTSIKNITKISTKSTARLNTKCNNNNNT